MMNGSEANSCLEDRVEREVERLDDESNKKQEHRIRKLEAKAVQNVNLYFIFQAVVLASSTSSSCNNSWIPMALSLIAAATNFITFSADMSRILKSREELDQNSSDLALIKLYQLTKDQLNQVLPGASFNHQGGEIVRPKVRTFKKWKRRFLVYMSICLFAGFSAIVMYGCRSILCHQPHGKCVKLC